MSDFDLLVRATQFDGSPIALGIGDGRIIANSSELSGSAHEEIDACDDLLLPGWIDAHVHFNEPGREDWEGLSSGSRALAAGGGTVFFDMPLNSTPPVLSRESFEKKRRRAEAKSHTDFALWGGLTPTSIDQIEPMAEAGAIGFKAFMCHSGLDEFPASDSATLKAGMTKAAALGLPVAVHAEIASVVDTGGKDMAAWLASRPIKFELEAINLALELAGETGCALHVVHVSCSEGIDLIRASSIDVTAETCPHYLLLNADEAIRIGAAAKCAPPLRGSVDSLWSRIDQVDTIGSDHSPSSPDLKQGDDLFAIWGGIAGIQHGLPLLLDRGVDLSAQISANVARRFRLERKGGLEIGRDADFSLIRRETSTITAADLVTKHPISPYIGQRGGHRVLATFLRGERISETTRGHFLRPTKH